MVTDSSVVKAGEYWSREEGEKEEICNIYNNKDKKVKAYSICNCILVYRDI